MIRKNVWLTEKRFRKLRVIAFLQAQPLGETVGELIDAEYKRLATEYSPEMLSKLMERKDA